ncbi:DUF3253 domain-containing protein [Williamsia sterculiae]|uniref:S-adenosylmethionine tRNA ribosyltransferase n=1 Tax=Williamsia sterculiae TaxID=1344003 RepID=A0A1N7FUK9_9NOCA|nr:DUF3253 domain-containing protein [Williamsia sterculiae]SIS03946.1 Protein of unknown function [Williamsia sterculiae]
MTPTPVSDKRIADTLLDLLDRRSPASSICPSDVARALRDDDWRALMPAVRRVADRLAADGRCEVTQRGEVVEAESARGPIRIRRPRQ